MLEEITPRLTQQLTSRVTFAANLKAPLALACHQLELLSPAVLGPTPGGLVAALATPLPPGTWLIVLANPTRVCTLQLRCPPGTTRTQLLTDCIEEAAAAQSHFGKPLLQPSDILILIDHVVRQYGGKPGAKTRRLQGLAVARIIGSLFATMPPDDRTSLLHSVEQAIEANICPLHVGLVGKGTEKGTRCGVWPLGLPFVPYLDSLGL